MGDPVGGHEDRIERVGSGPEDLTERREAEADAARLDVRLSRTLEAIADGFYVLDREWRFTYVNHEGERMLRRSRSELLGRNVWEEFPEAVGSVFDAEYHRAVETGEPVAFETYYAPLDVWVVVRAHPTDEGLAAYFLDVSARHHAEAALAASEQRYRSLFEQASDAILVADDAGRYVEANRSATELLGLPHESLVGRSLADFVVDAAGSADAAALWATLLESGELRGELRLRRPDGSVREVEFGAVANVAPGLHMSIFRDVTERRRFEEMAERRARILDALRRISPSEAPSDTAESICAEIVGGGTFSRAAIFAFDHDGGVTTLAARYSDAREQSALPVLRHRQSVALRERAALGAWVGDWIETDREAAAEARDLEIVTSVFAPIEAGGQAIGILAAGGAEPLLDPSSALPAVTEFGALASSLLGPGMRRRMELGIARQRISEVISSRRFRPVFQPIVDMETGEVLGHEALTRFDDEVAPNIVFRAAAEAGLGQELELATIEAALDHAPRLDGGFLDVNVSPELVLAGEPLARLLRRAGRDVILEITEHAQVDDYVALRQALGELGDRVRFAVDDAGAGFASLRHILELSPTHVKLDRGLVSRIDADPARHALVAGLVHFAERVDLRLIAEGVETKVERLTLMGLGVRIGQGYLFGRPE